MKLQIRWEYLQNRQIRAVAAKAEVRSWVCIFFVYSAYHFPNPCGNALEHIWFDFICGTEGKILDLAHSKKVLYHYTTSQVYLEHILNMQTEDGMSFES